MIALLVILAGLATTLAADGRAADVSEAVGANSWTGPVIDGRHRQPTEAKIAAREQVKARSSAQGSSADLARRGLGRADLYNNSATNPAWLAQEPIDTGVSLARRPVQ